MALRDNLIPAAADDDADCAHHRRLGFVWWRRHPGGPEDVCRLGVTALIITALTAQNTRALAALCCARDFVTAQMDAVSRSPRRCRQWCPADDAQATRQHESIVVGHSGEQACSHTMTVEHTAWRSDRVQPAPAAMVHADIPSDGIDVEIAETASIWPVTKSRHNMMPLTPLVF